MKAVTPIILSLLLGLIVVLNPAWSQEDMTVVDNSVFDRPQRSPALFDHDAHNEKAEIYDCAVCHHVYEDGELMADESSEDQRCSDCHGLTASGDQPALIKAFHSNCKGCHQEQERGPIMCGECHIN
jgi:hypothetical protein